VNPVPLQPPVMPDAALTALAPSAEQPAAEPAPVASQEAAVPVAAADVEPATTIEPVAAVLAPAEPASQPEVLPGAVLVATPAPTAADPIIVPQPAAVDVKESLQQVGLVMIETNRAAPAADAFTPTQPLGRKPRQAPVIASEPLQMVETKHD
jgi:hypothetical protein